MNARQRKMNRRIWFEVNGKYVFFMIIVLVILGLVGKQDSKTQLYEATINTCEQSYKVLDHDLEYQCGKLIGQVQDAHTEVLNKDGRFWIETK